MVITNDASGLQLICITKLSELKHMVDVYLSRAHLPVYADTETTGYKGSNKRTDKMVSLQFMQPGGAPVVFDARPFNEGINGRYIHQVLAPLFQSAVLVGVNLKFDYQMMLLNYYGLRMRKPWDCMIAEQIIYGMGFSDARSKNISFSFKAMGERRGVSISKEERETFKDMHLTPAWTQPFTEEQLNYAAQDVRELEKIYNDQLDRLRAREQMGCAWIEMGVLPAVSEMELNGLLIDQISWREEINRREEEAKPLEEELIRELSGAILQKRAEKFDAEREAYRVVDDWVHMKAATEEHAKNLWETTDNIDKAAGVKKKDRTKWSDFKKHWMGTWLERNPKPDGKAPQPSNALPNVGSPAQLMDAFSVLGIPAKNTRSDTLKLLKDEYPVVGTLLEWREEQKFISSFGESLLQKIDPITGRLHTTVMQIGASSERMSMVEPNMQQLPKGDIRKCIIAPPGWMIGKADYSSQELLILAELSGDENMLRLLNGGADLHGETARLMFNLGPDADPKKHMLGSVSAREAAKTINYGIAYGMTKYRLSKILKISTDSAQELIDAWFKAYPGVQMWLAEQRYRGERDLKVRTKAGWIRYFDPLPPEPVRPLRFKTQEEWKTWKELHRDWERLRGKLHNKAMNTPIQGLGAAMMKLAVSKFHTWIVENGSEIKILLAVHDEAVFEAPQDLAVEAGERLADCMDEAAKFFLMRVRVPRSEVKIERYWSK